MMLESRGCECWVQHNVRTVKGRTFKGKRGVPDILGFHRKTGHMVLAEVKTWNDVLSDQQALLLLTAANAGCITLIAHEDEKGNVVLTEFLKYQNK